MDLDLALQAATLASPIPRFPTQAQLIKAHADFGRQ